MKLRLVLLLLSAALAYTQDRGTIRGTVTDPTGAAIPAANVTIRNIDTGLTQSIPTGADGLYTIPYLPAGNYSVSTEKSGFRKAEATGVRVNVATITTVDVALTVGSVDQTVEVSAVTPLLEVQGSNLGKVVPTKAIRDLPLFIGGGIRSNLAFVILTPGVIGPANNPRIGGGLLDGQSEQLDGAEANSERRNDPAMNGVSVEGMEEFKVQSSGYSAEFGRTSNGVINWVTKSGTNTLHGSGFLFNRNEVFNARGFTFAPTKRPIVRQWNPGGSIGGPIVIPKVFDGRNKAFFFFAFERASTRNGQSTALVTAPVEEFRNGDMRRNVDAAGRTIPIYDPFDASGNIIANAASRPRMQCNGVLDVICPDRFDPTAKRLLALVPRPDDPTRIVNNYRSRSFSTSRTRLPSIKADYVFNDKHRASYLYSNFFSPATPSINNFEGVPGSGFPSEVTTEYHRYNDDYIFRPNLLNHLTIGFNHRHILEAPDYVSNYPADLARATYIPGTVAPLMPGTSSVYSVSGIQFGNSVFTDSRQRTTNIKEQISWLKGRHSMKFGFEYLRGIYRRLDFNGAFGTVSYSAAGTGNPNVAISGSDWASFLLGTASGGGFRYPGDTAFQWPYYAWFAQDDFKVSKKLTINIGLRYELPIPKQERNGRNSNFCPSCPNPAAGGLPGAMLLAGRDGAPVRFGETRKNAFGPRLGFAYQLDAKTVIRSGSAIYYQPSREDGNADNGIQGFAGTFGSIANSLSNGISYRVPTGFLPFSTQINALKPPVKDAATLSANLLNQAPFYLFPGAGRAPYFADWNFTLERSITSSSLIRASYHGVVGVKLLSRQQSQNQLDPIHWATYGSLLSSPVSAVLTNPTVVAAGFKLPYANFPTNLQLQQALRPFPQFTDLLLAQNLGGSSWYDAAQLTVKKRMGFGLQFEASYVWSKTMDQGEESVQSHYRMEYEKAVAVRDIPHRLVVSYLYELPFGKGRRIFADANPFTNALIGGWQFNGISTIQTGTPVRMTAANTAGTFADVVYANNNGRSGRISGSAYDRLNRWFDTSAFSQPDPFTFGNASPRINDIRTHYSNNSDLSLFKEFRALPGERVRIQFRAEALNALNRVQFSAPNTTVTNVAFGRVVSQANSPRQVQFGLKLLW